jgi:hypothetical protein
MSFIKNLRQSIVEKKRFQLWNEDIETEDCLTATSISFPPSTDKCKLSEGSGYKQYDCWTIIFFYTNHQRDHPTYLQICSQLDDLTSWHDKVTFMDRKDLLDYILGNTQESLHIKQKDSSKETSLFGFDLVEKRTNLSEDQKKDFDSTKRIKLLQRTVNDTQNILSIKSTKNFANIEKPAFAAFLTLKKSPKEQVKKIAKKNETHYIIVPAATQSLITLYNVKDFLIDQKYQNLIRFVHSDEIRNKGQKKPTKVLITRDPKKLSSDQISKFTVLDSIDELDQKEWDKVVACFASGQEWQFKGWKYTKPVDLFSRIKGFSLKFQDDPSQGMLGQWNVKQLQVLSLVNVD